MRQNFRRQFDQRINLDFLRALRLRPDGRREFQRTHAAYARIAKTFDGSETCRRPPLRRQPRINQRVAESVRQRIGK